MSEIHIEMNGADYCFQIAYKANLTRLICQRPYEDGLTYSEPMSNQHHTISNIVEIKELLPITPDNIEIWVPKLLKLKAFS